MGTVVAFDTDTGEVLDVVEKFVETEDGTPGYSKPQITSIECDEIRAEAVRSFPQRRVAVIVGPPQMDQGEEGASLHYYVDPNTQKLRIEPERDLIREAKRARVVGPKVRVVESVKKEKEGKRKEVGQAVAIRRRDTQTAVAQSARPGTAPNVCF